MKKLLLFLTLCLFIGLNMLPHLEKKEVPSTLQQASIISSLIGPAQKSPVYYVKINNTISLLKDPHGYILAAEKLKMEEIMIVPDGKYYRTVSLDLHKSDEDLKNTIPVKVNEIIRK